MDATSTCYTAKLTDGPLEGRTITTDFLDSGDPQSRLEIPAGEQKRYAYAYAGGLEFDNPGDEHPSAVAYRYLGPVFS